MKNNTPKIRFALFFLWGFDGFTVDVVTVEAFSDIMERFYRGAEGTNFKIALCIDNYRDISTDEMSAAPKTQYEPVYFASFRNFGYSLVFGHRAEGFRFAPRLASFFNICYNVRTGEKS